MPAKVITCTMRKTHPKAVVCSMCGGQFFPDSLKFHQKACGDKQKYIMLPCPFCEEEISKVDLSNHMEMCKKNQKSKIKKTGKIIEKKEESSEEEFDNLVDEQGRMKCCVCNRKFAQDRISIHQRICKKNNAQKSRGIFNSFKQRQFDNLIEPSEATFKKLNMKWDNEVGKVKKKSQGLSKSRTKAKQNDVKMMDKMKPIEKEKDLSVFSSSKKCDKNQEKSMKNDMSAESRNVISNKVRNEKFSSSNKNISYKSPTKSIGENRNCCASGKILTTNECSPDNTLAYPFGYNAKNVSYSSNLSPFEQQNVNQFIKNDDTKIFNSRKILPTNHTSYDYPMSNRSMYNSNR